MEPAKFYHLYNHANGNENLFRKDENYLFFLKKFAFYINPVADTYAYCLLLNA
jgi:putative transposase